MRHVSEIAEEEQKAKDVDLIFPRFIICSNDAYFNQLLNGLTLDNAAIVGQIWALLQRLPTNPTLKKELVSLEGSAQNKSGTPEWNQ